MQRGSSPAGPHCGILATSPEKDREERGEGNREEGDREEGDREEGGEGRERERKRVGENQES
jgi:hypothetical protein